jgi:hypothetical protein
MLLPCSSVRLRLDNPTWASDATSDAVHALFECRGVFGLKEPATEVGMTSFLVLVHTPNCFQAVVMICGCMQGERFPQPASIISLMETIFCRDPENPSWWSHDGKKKRIIISF